MNNFDFKKYLVENNLGPFMRPNGIESDQVVDVDSTLRALQAAVKSGANVTIDGEKVFKMPMINLATFEKGGRVQIPRNAEDLELAVDSILIDGKPMELKYKSKPAPMPKPQVKPFDPSEYSNPESIYYRGGD